jgi:hypothetical protein
MESNQITTLIINSYGDKCLNMSHNVGSKTDSNYHKGGKSKCSKE